MCVYWPSDHGRCFKLMVVFVEYTLTRFCMEFARSAHVCIGFHQETQFPTEDVQTGKILDAKLLLGVIVCINVFFCPVIDW